MDTWNRGLSCPGFSAAWDPDDQLIGFSKPSVTETYQYDHAGRRISKTSNGTTVHYRYNGEDIDAEYTASWSEAARWVHGVDADEPLMRLTGDTSSPDASVIHYHQDGINSVVATSTQSGAIAGAQLFDAWGNKVQSSGNIAQYGYTGREPDATGLIYYRARYYDPSIGRFISRDPAGMPDGVNRYAYVNNNPVNFTDPTGEYVNLIYGAIAGGVGGFITARASGQDFIGTLKSVGVGAGVGALVGAFNPALSNRAGAAAASLGLSRSVGTLATSAVVGGAASAAGQMAGNVVSGKLVTANFSKGAVIGSAIGGPAASLASKVVGNLAGTTVGTAVPFGSRTLTIVTPSVQRTASTFGALAEGALGGLFEASGEAIGSKYFSTTPILNNGASSASQSLLSFSQLSAPQSASGQLWGTSLDVSNYSGGGVGVVRVK